ncbi:carboxy-S-adenosyl-L-methionine synthase CmoA [Gilvimarinus sp. F26214L]|uniref:carboxy-S-adenosyl-L-methionine synthase CmoA n=1 Tax=Gilvimarinus sp. DZF01 TaxID=3461371 RepID=UPI004045870F
MSSEQQTDTIFANPLDQIEDFRFDESVVAVFPDMIKRSVPGYPAIISMIGELAGRYAQADSRCYDLGSSLGAATLAMRHGIKAEGCRIISIDNSEAMIARAEKILEQDDGGALPVELRCEDIAHSEISKASVVVLNFTLQFIPVEQRAALIQRIYDGLLPGGVLILSEKVCFADGQHQALMTELHHNFKRANGYSDLEIAQKRSAIEKVLIPESLATHQQRFRAAGFASADVWFQCLNFASMLAIK